MSDLRSGVRSKEASHRPTTRTIFDPASRVSVDLPDGPRRPRRRRRALTAALSTAALLAGVAGALLWSPQARDVARTATWFFFPPPPVEVDVTPDTKETGVRLDAPVRLLARHGRLTKVEVVAEDGERLDGAIKGGGRRWHSAAPLAPATRYEVRWSGRNAQDKVTRGTATFTTLTPDAQLEVEQLLPFEDETVGVGQPIIVRFSQPVTDKQAVERALVVEHSEGAHGAWSWFSDQEVRYRPEAYWPAYSTVELNANLAGVDAGGGLWGVQDVSLSFDIGARIISTVDVTTHTMVVEMDGEVVSEMPMSAGRPGWETQNGVHLVLDKTESAVFDSASFGMPGLYQMPVEWAVRLTDSGEYVHSAPWSVGDQGYANVSHGCVNLSPGNAAWFYEISQRGDILEVVGSDKAPEETEGMIEWNQSFEVWKEGSAVPSAGSPVQPV